MSATCETCKWFAVKRDKAGRRMLKGYAHKCIWPMPVIVLPSSVTGRYGFSGIPAPGRVEHDQTGCPCHEHKEPAP